MTERKKCPHCGYQATVEEMTVTTGDGRRFRRAWLRCLRTSYKISFGRGNVDRCKPTTLWEEPLS